MAKLARAALIPFPEGGIGEPVESEAIALDFNPSSLSLQLSKNSAAPTTGGANTTQHTSASQATLSFDAIFDGTRPPTASGKDSGGIGLSLEVSVDISIGGGGGNDSNAEDFDVRQKTSKIANLLKPDTGDTDNQSARKVRFQWGAITFDGVIESFSETLDYFSPDGVPLRSKVSLAIKQQDFTYQIDPVDRSGLRLSGGFGFELGLGVGFELGLDIGLGLDLELDLGLGVDLGFSASAGIDLSADAAIDVFGSAAVSAGVGGDVDLSLSGGNSGTSSSTAGSASGSASEMRSTSTAWAPAGPTAGTQAAANAAAVNQARASGRDQQQVSSSAGQFVATSLGGGAQPETLSSGTAASGGGTSGGSPGASALAPVPPTPTLPVRGSPPLVTGRRGPAPAPGLFSRTRYASQPTAGTGAGRPRWEVLPPDTTSSTDSKHPSACGCNRCRS